MVMFPLQALNLLSRKQWRNLCHRVSIKVWGHYFTPTEFPALGVALTKITFRVGHPSFYKKVYCCKPVCSLFFMLQHINMEAQKKVYNRWTDGDVSLLFFA